MSYSLFFFFFIQLAIKHISTKVTANTVCKNGFLIQMSEHFECLCKPGYVLTSEDNCEMRVKCQEDTLTKPCRDFGTCVVDPVNVGKFACKCNAGFVKGNDSCIPANCLNVNCKEGKCLNNPDTGKTLCSCNIGTVLDVIKNECVTKGETKCTLPCPEKTQECVLENTYYKCDCKEGFALIPGTDECSFSLFNILNLSIVFIISLIFLYIIWTLYKIKEKEENSAS